MKKILILAGAALSMAACTSEDFINEAPKVGKGITFELGYPAGMVETRGALQADRNFFWYAETDRINLYALGASGTQATTNWVSDIKAAVYKATKSSANGQFTSIDDVNKLTFANAETTIDAIATYPKETTVTSVELVGGTGEDKNNIKSAKYSIASNATQDVRLNELVAPMVGFSNDNKQNENWESVGEKVKFNLNRVYPVIKLGTVANNEKYNKYLGKLTKVELENITKATVEGGWSLANGGNIAGASTYNSKDQSFEITSNESTKITANITHEEWKAGDFVNLSVLPIYAKEEKGGGEQKVEQAKALSFKITYTFENVTLVKEITQKVATDIVASKGDVNNMVYNIYNLDIAKDFPWIVTNNKALLVFNTTEAFSDVYTDKNHTNVEWAAPANENPTITTITGLYSEVVLTDAELKELAKYDALTSVELPNQTSICKGTFSTTNAANITKLLLPAVTTYNDDKAFAKLTDLDLRSYAFANADEDVATLFFNDNVKNTLVNCNIAAVTSLSPIFGYERNILFTGYASLKSITLNAEKTIISANEFKDCENLEEVNGVVEMTTADNAFENVASNVSDAKKYPVITMFGTDIPASAFKGANIATIKQGGKAIVPTTIGASAFYNNTAIETLDLKAVTEMGGSAFNGATKFKGIGKNGVVTLNVETVPANAFYNTAIVRFQLMKATTVKSYALASTALKQVKFRQNVAAWNQDKETGIHTQFIDAPANSANVDLFIKTLADKAAFGSMTFKTVTVDDTDWTD